VTTDIWGRFAINNIPDGSSLIFFCNGYKTYTMPPLIVSNSALHVRLVKDPDFNEKSTETKHKVDSAAKPLIVINGKISEIPIEELDPQTIESMNVLKDKTATDKYGVEGKNGVIEIITKEPTKEEKPIPRSGSSRMRINY
jgi:TonB-dependent SusC/RagA subfamily outer membrane receptor